MIVAPRVWVKNKKASLVYNGHISEQIRLFHGSNGRLLFYIGEAGEDPDHAYVYTPENGLWDCGHGAFVRLKLIALSVRWHASCGDAGTGDRMHVTSVDSHAIHFLSHNRTQGNLQGGVPGSVPVIVSWQDPPR